MKQQKQQQNKTFIDQEEFYLIIQEQVDNWLNNPSHHYKIEKAKNEGWFGSLHSNRDHKGLLGYLRLNFGKQIKILNNLGNHLPIYDSRFADFFRGSFFENEVIKNDKLKPFYKREHFDIIKKRNICTFKNINIDNFITEYQQLLTKNN